VTWVVGRTFFFGYAASLSDIQVTVEREGQPVQTFDCLQKTYQVARNATLSFAGSVPIGFRHVEAMRSLLSEGGATASWDPLAVTDEWPDSARRVWDASSQEEQEGGSQLMLLVAHPTENTGPIPKARCYAYRFVAPHYQTEEARGAVSIGSGALIPEYVELLDRHQRNIAIVQAERAGPGGSAQMLLSSLKRLLNRRPEPGISTNLLVGLVWRERVEFSEHCAIPIGRPQDEGRLPSLVTSWDELVAYLGAHGLSAVRARC
jgi:hypothetical protein